MTSIFLKNMVCRHCIEAALDVFRELDLEVTGIKLGEATLAHPTDEIDFALLNKKLSGKGFEIIEDKEKRTVEQVKTAIIQFIHQMDTPPEVKNSVYLSEKLGHSYAWLSKLFSRHEGITIEKYIILQKIERVKELVSYDEKSLSEIAFDLGYSSVQHLSSQFRSVTGMPVTAYKKLDVKPRRALNEVRL